MEKGAYVAVSGSMAQERAMDMITNNLANVNTPGFKGDRLLFESFLQKSLQPESGIPTPEQIKNGSLQPGVEDSEYLLGAEGYTDFSQGGLQRTSNPMDIALKGDGFLTILTPDGERYTRGGTFVTGETGELVTKDGYPLLNDKKQPIFVDGGAFSIGDKGLVTGADGEEIANLLLVKFEDRQQLKKEGNNLYSASDTATGSIATDATVKQGYIEGSNINAVREMAKMITALRSYQTFQKAIQSHSEMTTRLINEVGRP